MRKLSSGDHGGGSLERRVRVYRGEGLITQHPHLISSALHWFDTYFYLLDTALYWVYPACKFRSISVTPNSAISFYLKVVMVAHKNSKYFEPKFSVIEVGFE